MDDVLGEVEELSVDELAECVRVVEARMLNVDLEVVQVRVQMPIRGRLELGCDDGLRIIEVDLHCPRVREQVLVVVVEHDSPASDHGQLHVDDRLLVDSHVCEVEGRVADVNLERIVDQVVVVKVKVSGERSDGNRALLFDLQVPVHVRHAVLQQVLLDKVRDGLRHAQLQAWLVHG